MSEGNKQGLFKLLNILFIKHSIFISKDIFIDNNFILISKDRALLAKKIIEV